MTFFLDFVIAFTIASILIPIVLRMARKRRLFDRIDERKIHTGDIPRLGGIGIALGFLAALIGTILLVGERQGTPFPEPRFWVLLGAGIGFSALGLVDDLRNLPGRLKLFVQLILAIAVVSAGYGFRTISLPGILGPVNLGALGPVVSVLWIVGIANAYNLMDGMDGMAGGISFIALGVWAAFYLKDGQQYLATIMAIAGAGAVLGFLFYNFPPASIFMGDSGSLFLGFLIAVLPLMGTRGRMGDTVASAGVTICLLPILDTLTAILRRWKRKVSFFTADKYHLHHKLLNLGFSTRQVLAYTYSACSLLGAAVLGSAYVNERSGGLLMLVSWILGVALFLFLHYLKERHIRLSDVGSEQK
jgi:UDP-GlcNAc:undecaprenyl-phosphate/decaprenyl-phosphate GlcNAc-1-phosphate transferase